MFLPSKKNEILKSSAFSILIIFIIGMAIYANILNAPFQYDDNELLLKNPLVKVSPDIVKIFSRNRLKAVTIYTFAINYNYGGMNTFGYHLFNILIHVSSAFLLWKIIQALISAPGCKDDALKYEKEKFSLFIALIFLVHPLQTQSVTYIWQRTESLSGLFYLASYLLYLNGRLKGKWYLILFSSILFFVGLFAKGIIISLPAMVLLTESYFLRHKGRSVITALSKILVCIFLFVLILSFFPIKSFQLLLINCHKLCMTYTGMQLSRTYFLTQFRVVAQYIRLSFLPVGQNLDYYFPFSYAGWNWQTILSFVFISGVFTAALKLYKKHRFMSFGIFWFFICLLPTTFVYREPMWEHRMYLSIAGFSMFIVSFMFTVVPKRRIRDAVIILLICVFGMLTVARNYIWRDPILLLEDTVRKSPDKARPNQVLGYLYRREGKLEEAEKYLKKALFLKPDYPEACNNLGLVYLDKKEYETAKEYFRKAIMYKRSFLSPYVNLASIALIESSLSEAEGLLKASLRFGKQEETYVVFGNIYSARKKFDEARVFFEMALEINKNSFNAYYSIGNSWFYEKNFEKAIEFYGHAMKIDPLNCDVYLNTGMAYYYLKDMDAAKKFLNKAKEIDPKREDVQMVLDRSF